MMRQIRTLSIPFSPRSSRISDAMMKTIRGSLSAVLGFAVAVFGALLAWAAHFPWSLVGLVGLVTGLGYAAMMWLLARFSRKKEAADVTPLLARAQSAFDEINDLSAKSPSLDVSSVRATASGVMADFKKGVDLVSLIDSALTRIDLKALESDRLLIEAQMRSLGSPSDTLSSSKAQVDAQLEVYKRLSRMRSEHLQRLHSLVIGLDGIVAQIAELSALSSATGKVDLTEHGLSDTSASLDSLRKGFAESASETERLLGNL